MAGDSKTETSLTVGDVKVGLTVEKKAPPEEKTGCGSVIAFIATIPLIVIALMALDSGASVGSGGSPVLVQQAGTQRLGNLIPCEPGITVGGRGETVAKVTMRADPGYLGKDNAIGWCKIGERLLILAGPSETDNLCWWRVRSEFSGEEGWVADHARDGLRLLRPSQ